MKKYGLLAAALATVISMLVAASTASGLGDLPTVRPVPPSGDVSSDAESFDVEIMVEDVVNLGAFQIILSYDPAVLHGTSFVRGDFLGSSGREILCQDPTIDEAAMRLECISLRDSPAGPDGEGVLAIASFEPVEDGTSELTITRAALTRPDGSSLAANVQSARVTVSGGSGYAMFLVIGGAVVAGLVVAGAAAMIILSRRRNAANSDVGAPV